MPITAEPLQEIVIEPRHGLAFPDLGELSRYRDLLRYMTWRGIRARYAQSALGIGWAVIQPATQMIIFSIIFGRLAGMSSEGVPYPLFAICGLVPWTFFSMALTGAAGSLVENATLLGKVYFPRIIMPLSAIGSRLVDLVIGLAVMAVVMAMYGVAPPASALLWGPLMVSIVVLTLVGAGLWLSAMAVQYRDVAYAMNFFVQILMYLTPVVYPASVITGRYRAVIALNPMSGAVSGFRAAMLGQPLPWDLIGIGAAVAVALVVTGALYFRRTERLFADVA